MATETESPNPVDGTQISGYRETRLVDRVLAALVSISGVFAISCALLFVHEARMNLVVQFYCLTAAWTWIFWSALAGRPSASRSKGPRREIAFGIALVGLAMYLRASLRALLPVACRSCFEELQMGADAYKLLSSGILELEFRFSKLLASFGLWFDGSSLDGLRTLFEIAGYVNLGLLFLCLQALEVGWGPRVFVVMAAACSRWKVIASGAAYEDFSAIPILYLLLLALIKMWALTRTKDQVDAIHPGSCGGGGVTTPVVKETALGKSLWLSLAGFCAGILMYENSSFRFAILMAAVWVLWVAIRTRQEPNHSWSDCLWCIAFFAGPFLLVAAPMLINVARRGTESVFFEAIVRYAHGRPGMLPDELWPNLISSLRTLAGLRTSCSLYLMPSGQSAIFPLIGFLFACGAVSALLRPRSSAVRMLVFFGLVAVVACSATTNFFNVARLSSILPILLLAAGDFLEQFRQLVRRGVARLRILRGRRLPDLEAGQSRSQGLSVTVAEIAIFGALTSVCVIGCVHRVQVMARDHRVWDEYHNDQYVAACYIAQRARINETVVVVTPQRQIDWSSSGVAYWLYAAKNLQISGVSQLPRPDQVKPNTLIVLETEGGPLDPGDIAALAALGRATGSLASLELFHGYGGRNLVASIRVGATSRPND